MSTYDGVRECPAVDSGGSASIAGWTPTGPNTAAVGIDQLTMTIPKVSSLPTLDGDLSDWEGIPFMAQTQFSYPGSSDFMEFYEYGGGTWNGASDQASAIAALWTPEAMVLGVKVIDDSHQNPGAGTAGDPALTGNGGAGWNGDAVQVMIAGALRGCGMGLKCGTQPEDTRCAGESGYSNCWTVDGTADGIILYNYGLHEDGTYTHHHEGHPCAAAEDCTEAGMFRDEAAKTTVYEIIFPAESMGVDSLSQGYKFGLSICVNDGDQGDIGRKGWSGFAPYAVNNDWPGGPGGKSAENAGSAVLGALISAGGSSCVADGNVDGKVDVTDLLGLLSQFGGGGSYDMDGNGVVDVTDLLALLAEFGSSGC
jgi:hypothetical protein